MEVSMKCSFFIFPSESKTSRQSPNIHASMATWLVARGNELDSDVEILYRPFRTLSQGEQMKVMLAVLFSGQHEFLIIDEPTNHLDFDARQTEKNI